MRKEISKLTVAQFANLHHVNKRTLHYYDEIGLFSPCEKKENGYRMYDLSQSLDFEYIRMLKELDMSIDEIKQYYQQPSSEKFLEIANRKLSELDDKIAQLKHLKNTLKIKKEQVCFCQTLKKAMISIEQLPCMHLSTLSCEDEDLSSLFSTFKQHWNMDQIRSGIGGYLSLDKVKQGNFTYDGYFTFSKKGEVLPKGKYLCGYQKGKWEELGKMYEQMLVFAHENGLELVGNAYEIGLNEFVISDEEDYVTKIFIRIGNV